MNALGGLASLAAPVVTGLMGSETQAAPIIPLVNPSVDSQYYMALSRLQDPGLFDPEPPNWGTILAVGAITFAAVYLAIPAA